MRKLLPTEQIDMNLVTAYVNSGGEGQRLLPIMGGRERHRIAKALLEVGDPPIKLIDHQIHKLTAARVGNIVIGAGDHADVSSHVQRVYEDRYDIQVAVVDRQLGTGGDLIRTLRHYPEWFHGQILISNVDTILDVNEAALMAAHRENRRKNAALTIALTLRKGVPNEGAFYIDSEDRVIYSREAATNPVSEPQARKNSIYQASSTGAVVIEKSFLEHYDWGPQEEDGLSLYGDLTARALEEKMLFGFNNQEHFFMDVGTPATWRLVQEQPGLVQPHLAY